MTALLRVVGAPGSGKTLLIVSLVEELRGRGYRVASAVRRGGIEAHNIDPDAAAHLDAGAAATVIVLASGGRVTLEQVMPLPALSDIVASLDPQIDLLLAEGFADAGIPAVELAPGGSREALTTDADDLLAVVSSEELRGSFARLGPGDTNGLADLVQERLLGEGSDVEMRLTVDGMTLESTGFVTDMIARPVLTMVEQLKGVLRPRAVRLHIRRRRRDGEGE